MFLKLFIQVLRKFEDHLKKKNRKSRTYPYPHLGGAAAPPDTQQIGQDYGAPRYAPGRRGAAIIWHLCGGVPGGRQPPLGVGMGMFYSSYH